MNYIFILISITSIWILGLTVASQENMVLYFIREWADEKKSKWYDPLIRCHWCMPSIHSAFGYLFSIGSGLIAFEWRMLIAYPIVVCGSSFVCGLLWAIYKKIDIETKYYYNQEQNVFFDLKDRKAKYKRETSNHH